MHRFHVADMTCGHCVQKVSQAVKGVDPDASLQTDLPSHSVTIKSKAASSRFLSAIQAAGFTPREAAS